MATKKATKKSSSAVKAGRGRPQLYPLTSVQEKSVRTRLAKGQSRRSIAAELDIHEFAVLRISRQMTAE